jgi:5'-3' exoribonuclease 1
MANTFSARERKFISSLAEDLHLLLAWDEYDEEDQNLVTWRFPETMAEPIQEQNGTTPDGDDGEWVDEEDEEEEESRIAVDRVLRKYERAPVLDDDDGGFDARYEQSIKEKMDEWKRTYYRVRSRLSRFCAY